MSAADTTTPPVHNDGQTTTSAEDPEGIPIPDSMPRAAKLALSHSKLLEVKGSSFRFKCNICGFKATTSAHKLIYGHYLREAGNDIGTCVDPEKLEADYPEFYSRLIEKRDKLAAKRRYDWLACCH